MKLKKGVKLLGVKPELIIGLIICNTVYEKHGVEMVITSKTDGKHRDYSDHYKGYGMDLRTRNIPDVQTRSAIEMGIKESITEDYRIIFEKDHFHFAYKPRN